MTDTKLDEAASRTINELYPDQGEEEGIFLEEWYPSHVRSEMLKAFKAGAAWERARILALLRSDEAENAPKPFRWNFVIEKTYNTAKGWADWIEKELSK